MAIISVTTTATEVADGKKMGQVGAGWAVVQNLGAATVHIDDVNTVTADTAATGGVQIAPGDSFTYPVSGSTKLYGIVASGTVNVAVMSSAGP